MTATARDILAETGCLLATISELAPKFGTEDVRMMADVVALAQLAALDAAGLAIVPKGTVGALRVASIRLEILTGRMRSCREETGQHDLIDEAEMFVEEAVKAVARLESAQP